MSCSAAVALLLFNRPELTAQTFAAVARARPKKLFLIADGPRGPEETERCERARAACQRVDWDCEVATDFSPVNLGCKRRVSSGLDWLFAQVDEAIVLEDDCLPHPSFFPFCGELLEKYRHDERIMAVSGDNFQRGSRRTSYSYYYSRYLHVWGWASWRRAWQHYDRDMKLWPSLRDTAFLRDLLGEKRVAEFWTRSFDKTYAGHVDTWDYQWQFACWSQSALTILPEVNLVSNVGFGSDATHTRNPSEKGANVPAEAMEFPLRHPPCVIRNREADDFTFEHHLGFGPPPKQPLAGQFQRLFSRLLRRGNAVQA